MEEGKFHKEKLNDKTDPNYLIDEGKKFLNQKLEY
jgi:hypothetical protein